MIPVTKTWLPYIRKYQRYVEKIYANGWVTNGGPLVKELEARLADYLGVKHIVLVSNGTAALEIAYRTLGLRDYVVTTPFSFVATTSSLVANGLHPIFADIDAETLCIDPQHIETVITPHTEAIVPVHVFGNVCDVEAIEIIAKRHNLKVIYDAAHTFGVRYKEKSVLNYGDISVLSFHATKLFHTIEGGALIIDDEALVRKARYLINFGIEGPESIPALGTNAKMNEFEAAMGLCMLDEIDVILQMRHEVWERYYHALSSILTLPRFRDGVTPNYAYFPVIFENEAQRKRVQYALNKQHIYPRRYFYPSLDTLEYIEPKQFCSVSRDISGRILALPMYPDLPQDVQQNIIDIIRKELNMSDE
jgi:dTDP-4-amino-4,6-dideoxygalactose transaminase